MKWSLIKGDKKITQKFKEWSKKKKTACITAGVLVAVMVVGGIPFFYLQANAGTVTKSGNQEVTVEKGNLSLDLTETGTTAVGTVSQTPDFDVSTVDMTIAEVYVEAGDTVSAGDALYKLSDDCLEELKTYYEEEVADAEKDLETAKLNLSSGKLEASYDKESSDSTASRAAAEYQAGIDELAQAVTDTQTDLTNSQTLISTYQGYLDSNTYYTENGITEKTQAVTDAGAAYDAAKSTCDTAKTQYDVAAQALQTAFADSSSVYSTLKTLYDAEQTALATYQTTKTDLEAANKTLTDAEKALESAQTKYDTQVKNAQDKVDTLTSSLDSLQSAYDTAVISQTTEAVELKNTYDEAVLNGNYSGTTYESTVTTLQNAVDTAQDQLDTLTEEQNALLALSDGVITASQDGTIASMTYEVDNIMIPTVALATYYDTSVIDISVEISQEEIAKIAVGDSVDITISGYRGDALQGTVATVATSATSGGSLSSVYYTVVVAVDNSAGELSTGSSAAVTFSFGELSDVLYLPIDAVSNVSGTSGEVKTQDADGNIISSAVTVGESTDQYIVITDGLEEGDTCLIVKDQTSEQ